MPTIEVNETTLYYERSGEGPAVVFIHGMCGDADVWVDQADRLADRYTCVRYDRRGHTRSSRGDATISNAQHAADAAALIEALDLAPCLLVTSSGGAAIGVEVARQHGHLLRGAVFSEPPLFSVDPEAGQEFVGELLPLVEAAISSGGPRAGVDAFFSFVCPGLWSAIDDSRKDRYRANADIGFADLEAPPLQLTADDLATITVPTLVIAGTESHPSLRSVARRLAAALPDTRYVELQDCGHVTYAEQPDEFAHAVSVFASEVDRFVRRTERFDVQSADGTSIAVWVEGEGPPLVMVHGSFSDHSTFDPLIAELRATMTTYAMDRRGFGASGDQPTYAIERDFEDVAAVVDAVAARSGSRVALWGHSYGANCAMGGAALTSNVRHVVLYEPSLGIAYPVGSIDKVEAMVASGDIEDAVIEIFVGILEMSDDEVEELRASARWPHVLANGPTVVRECRAEDTWRYEPGQFAAITAPTLFLLGSESVPSVVEATHAAANAIDGSRINVLEGHGHFAHKTDPRSVAALVRAFSSRT